MHPAVKKYQQLPVAQINEPTWAQASDKARSTAQARSVIVRHLITSTEGLNQAFCALAEQVRKQLPPPKISSALAVLGKLPSRASVYNWVKSYKAGGVHALLPAYKGGNAKAQPWQARALALYHTPNSPSFAMVSDVLNKEGFNTNAQQIRRFINTMPHELGAQSPYRMGAKLYREKHKDHLLRSTQNIPAGFIYNGDGHTLDVHLAHPKTGRSYRAELTAFQDVASRCIVGWELGVAENTIDTLSAISRAITTHNHVPAMFYLDNGSGYKSKLMNDKTTGFYAQHEIDVVFAIPGNARAKWIERFFLHMEDRVGKKFDTYCGRDHDNRHLLQVLKEVKQGKRQLPTVDEWIAEFTAFLDEYHNSPHPERKNQTRLDVWKTLEPVPPVQAELILPREKVNVRRGRVVLHKRAYSADYLFQFNGQSLIAAYDLHDDSYLKLYRENGEFLLIATLKSKTPALPQSRIEEGEQRRLKGRIKRLENAKQEVMAQEAQQRIIDVQSVNEYVEHAPNQDAQTDQNVIDVFDFAVTEQQSTPNAANFDLNELLNPSQLKQDNNHEL